MAPAKTEAARQTAFRPRRWLGQNFLVDKNMAKAIVEEGLAGNPPRVLEIGPGHGALTYLLAQRVPRLVAVEKDPHLAAEVADALRKHPGAEAIAEDFLRFDLSRLADQGIWRLVANLPYSVTSPILFRLLEHTAMFDRWVLLVQEEVADRMLAQPGRRQFGPLAANLQLLTKVEKVRTVPATCFRPQPEVESCLVRVSMLGKPIAPVDDVASYRLFVRRLFQQRRKSVASRLRDMHPGLDEQKLKEMVHTVPDAQRRRPEHLAIAELASLSQLSARLSAGKEGGN